MAQIASIDWPNKRFYLHVDTVTSGFDAWEASAEVRALVQANANDEQNFSLFIHRQGKVTKRPGKFTPRYVSFNTLWRGVPYDGAAHELSLLVEMISDDEVVDKDVFDRSGVAVEVDIDAIYEQVEVIEVSVGGAVALLPEQIDQLASIPQIEIDVGLIQTSTTNIEADIATIETGIITINNVSVLLEKYMKNRRAWVKEPDGNTYFYVYETGSTTQKIIAKLMLDPTDQPLADLLAGTSAVEEESSV